MMVIYLLFPAIVVVLDYLLWQKHKQQGAGLIDVALAAAGIGILVLGLPFLLQSNAIMIANQTIQTCLLYTSPSPRDRQKYRMPSSA